MRSSTCRLRFPPPLPASRFATLYGPHGWIGSWLVAHGLAIAYTPAGIVLALAFVGLPFVVRTVQPIVATLPREFSEAAGSLGASPLTILRRITLPLLAPALLTGFALALARTLGEYGSVIFIAGNLPLKTEIAPLVIVTRLEEYDYAGAAAVAVVCLAASFAMLLTINNLATPAERPAERRMIAADSSFARPAAVRHKRRGLGLPDRLAITAVVVLLGFFVALPLVSDGFEAVSAGAPAALATFADPYARSAIALTLVVTLITVAINGVLGVLAAWTLAKYAFPGKAFVLAVIDLPLTVSPVVAGLAILLCFGIHSPIGAWLDAHGWKIAFAPPGIILATIFVTFPYVARETLALMNETGRELEEAALGLGASVWQTFWRVTFPGARALVILSSVLVCRIAQRALGEFGAVSVISGKIRGRDRHGAAPYRDSL